MTALIQARNGALRRCGMVPSDPNAWDRLGMILIASGDPAAAYAAFAEGATLAPAAVDIALHQVEAATAAGLLPDTLRRLDEHCAKNPFAPAAHTARGVTLERLGRHADALDALEIATALAPDAALPACLLAVSWRGPAACKTPRRRCGRPSLWALTIRGSPMISRRS